ncbi:hypothetical protein BDW62DRAFT_195094 [Aspergillus aurantiobrunneus]
MLLIGRRRRHASSCVLFMSPLLGLDSNPEAPVAPCFYSKKRRYAGRKTLENGGCTSKCFPRILLQCEAIEAIITY